MGTLTLTGGREPLYLPESDFVEVRVLDIDCALAAVSADAMLRNLLAKAMCLSVRASLEVRTRRRGLPAPDIRC